MTKNPYFSYSVKSEQDLWEDIVIESIQMYGEDIYYLPRTLVDVDTIFKDDVSSSFNSFYKIEIYPENIEGFDGDGDLFSKFGIEIRDQMTFVMSKRRWKIVSSRKENEIPEYSRPKEGDLIFFPMSKSLFEISKVEHESPFYQLKNITVYKLQCNLFEYNDEQLNTGIDDIDDIEADGTYNIDIYPEEGFNYDLLDENESYLFKQSFANGVEVTAEIVDISRADNRITLAHLANDSDGNYHMIKKEDFDVSSLFDIYDKNNENVVADGTIGQFEERLDEFAQNEEFEKEVEDILDFTEENPFGRF